jgi:hypothetical protein
MYDKTTGVPKNEKELVEMKKYVDDKDNILK